MKKGCLVTYYSISLIFFLLVAGLSAFRIRGLYQDNTREVNASFETLRVSALSTYLAEGSFTSDYFRAKMRAELSEQPRLLLVSITAADGETHYLLAKNRRYLADDASQPAGESGPAAAPLSRYLETELEIPFAPGITRDLYFRGRFQLLSRQDVYPLLKEIFYITMVYVLISGILLLLIATGRDRATAAGRSLPPSRSAASGQTPGGPRRQPAAAGPQPQQAAVSGTGFFSPRSGLGWQELLESRLEFELERAASFDQDLVLACLALDPGLDAAAAPAIYRQVGAHISETFPFKDLCFEDGRDAYAVLLPDKELDQALTELQRFQSRIAAAAETPTTTVSVGLSARAGRLLSAGRLLKEAHAALQQAKSAGSNQIVAFRADPEKYRRAVKARGR
jgi:GGDEF domain-containing protein